MTINPNGLFVQSDQGRSYYFGQDLYTFKAIGEDTGEAYALCEVIVAPQGGTPPHRHSRENESFYVQDGEIEFQLDDRTLVATAGTFLHSPLFIATSFFTNRIISKSIVQSVIERSPPFLLPLFTLANLRKIHGFYDKASRQFSFMEEILRSL